jgi:hypothetical protein
MRVRGRLLDLPCPAKFSKYRSTERSTLSDLFDDLESNEEIKRDTVTSSEVPFVQIPLPVLRIYGKELGACGVAVYAAVKSYANYRSQTCFLLIQTIANQLDMGESTVRRELSKLTGLGLLSKKTTGRSLIFHVENLQYRDVADRPLPESALIAISERSIYKEKFFKEKVLTEPTFATLTVSEDGPKKVYDHYISVMGKNPKTYDLTPSRRKKLETRFHECVEKTKDELKAIELMKVSVDNCADSPFHMGKNENGKKYNDLIDNIFKSYEQMEKWWND